MTSVEGIIFDVKEFAQNDGDGIRTTVFFKGCPLRCVWCHNPEGLSKEPELYVAQNGCLNCGLCRRECSHEECRDVGRCLHICPKDLVRVAGRRVRSDELAADIKKRADFEAFGGVTLSGGEPLMQPEFAEALLLALKPLSTAIETSGYAPSEIFAKIIGLCDFVMMDLKLADREAHKKFTGVYNDRIIENLSILKNSGKPFLLRTPLIPGITDTEKNLKGIARLADGAEVELLPYNSLAGAKYPAVGRVYTAPVESNRSRITDTKGLPQNFKIK